MGQCHKDLVLIENSMKVLVLIEYQKVIWLWKVGKKWNQKVKL